jgi:hypothetical protein
MIANGIHYPLLLVKLWYIQLCVRKTAQLVAKVGQIVGAQVEIESKT